MVCDPAIVNGLVQRIERQQDWILWAITGGFLVIGLLMLGLIDAMRRGR